MEVLFYSNLAQDCLKPYPFVIKFATWLNHANAPFLWESIVRKAERRSLRRAIASF
jgi:hypothetical protein